MLAIGIDISKASFDVAFKQNQKEQHNKFTNDLIGCNALIKWLGNQDKELVFCMEATGVYGLILTRYLIKLNLKFMVVNPIKIKYFAKMEMTRNKTDKSDAQLIARFCQYTIDNSDLETSLFKQKDQNYQQLQQLVTRIEQLEKHILAENNRLEISDDKLITQSIQTMIKASEKEILIINEQIDYLVKSSSLNDSIELISSIDGIGKKTAYKILAYMGDLSLFDNSKQATSFAGLNPSINQSGSCLDTSSMSKMGNKRLRRSLYMPAMCAARYNPLLKDLYERLVQKGKPKKLALGAVMRKLIVLAYGVIKSQKPFNSNYIG